MLENSSETPQSDVVSGTAGPGDSSSPRSAGGDGRLDVELLQLVAYGYVWSSLAFIGIVGNVLNLAVLNSHRHYRNQVAYTYIRWMAFSDLMLQVIAIPEIIFTGFTVRTTSYEMAWFLAHMCRPMMNVWTASSALLVVAVTTDRFVGICWPLRGVEYVTAGRCRWMVVVSCYVAALVGYVPMGLQYQPVKVTTPDGTLLYYKIDRTSVDSSFGYGTVYKTSREVLFKILPVLLVIVMSVGSLVAFRMHASRLHRRDATTAASASDRKRERDARRLMAMLVVVCTVYVVCVLPMAFMFMLSNNERRQSPSFQLFNVVANLLEIFNSAANFYLYCVASRDFRKHFKDTFLKYCHCHTSRHCLCGVVCRAVWTDGDQAVGNGNNSQVSDARTHHVTSHHVTTQCQHQPHSWISETSTSSKSSQKVSPDTFCTRL